VNAASTDGRCQTDEPDEVAAGPDLDGPQAVAVAFKLFAAPIHHRVGLVGGQQRGEMLHRQRVGVQGCEWHPVTLPPLPKDQPRCRGFDQRRGHDLDGIGLLAEAHLAWSHKGTVLRYPQHLLVHSCGRVHNPCPKPIPRRSATHEY